MRSGFVSFHWKERAAIRPALVMAADFRGNHVPSVSACLHPYWVLDYAFARHGAFRVRNRREQWRTRTARSAHLYPPYTRYWEDTRTCTGQRHSAWLIFMGGAEAGVGASHDFTRFQDPEGLLGKKICEAAHIGHAQGENGFWNAQSVLCQVIQSLTRAERMEKGTYRISASLPDRTSDFVNAVYAFLRAHLNRPVSLAETAGHLNMSLSALSHRFQKETGTSVITVHQTMRIEQARALLLRGFSLATIAHELGYSDAFHLSKVFKHVTGLAPRNFLKALVRPVSSTG